MHPDLREGLTGGCVPPMELSSLTQWGVGKMRGEHGGNLSRGCGGLMAVPEVSGQCTPRHGDCMCLREAGRVGAEHGV